MKTRLTEATSGKVNYRKSNGKRHGETHAPSAVALSKGLAHCVTYPLATRRRVDVSGNLEELRAKRAKRDKRHERAKRFPRLVLR